MNRLRIVLALALMTVALPNPAQALTLAGTPQSGLKMAVVTLTTTKPHRYTVEIAQTPEQQAIGMMYRQSLAPGHGMLFPFTPPPRLLTIWMENTYIPLDVVFIGADRRVVSIAADATPMSREHLTSAGPAAYVLELKGGEAARIGLKPGDRVEIGPAK